MRFPPRDCARPGGDRQSADEPAVSASGRQTADCQTADTASAPGRTFARKRRLWCELSFGHLSNRRHDDRTVAPCLGLDSPVRPPGGAGKQDYQNLVGESSLEFSHSLSQFAIAAVFASTASRNSDSPRLNLADRSPPKTWANSCR